MKRSPTDPNKTEQRDKNSPPYKGGVARAARRGGSPASRDQLNNLEYLKPFRKSLRSNLTPAEAALWNAIKNDGLAGRKFRRQHSVGNYVLDFYCPSEKLAVELDGEKCIFRTVLLRQIFSELSI